MPLTKVGMRSVIMRNGHLKVTGEETADELRMALLYLRQHTLIHCRKAHLGIPIETLIPDISVVVGKSTRFRNAQRATIAAESQ